MPVLDWEKTITCPYNPSHQITVERIQVLTSTSQIDLHSLYLELILSLNLIPVQFHLVKCRKNHAGSDLKVCPFNASHHVPAPEEEFHMKTCSDRKVKLDNHVFLLVNPIPSKNASCPFPRCTF